MEIAGKVAVVSGGASGIGRASARAERGASVVIADLDEVRGRQTAEMATAQGGIAHFRRGDVTQSGDIEAVFETALKRYGRLDIAFNNAGISGEDFFANDPGDWQRLIAIGLTAVIDATRLAVRRTGDGGVVINTASLIGSAPVGVCTGAPQPMLGGILQMSSESPLARYSPCSARSRSALIAG